MTEAQLVSSDAFATQMEAATETRDLEEGAMYLRETMKHKFVLLRSPAPVAKITFFEKVLTHLVSERHSFVAQIANVLP